VSKKLYKGLGISLATLLLVGIFAFSPWGTRAILYGVHSTVSGLDIEYGSGGLSSELNITRVSWRSEGQNEGQNQGTSIEIVGLSLDVNWSCSMALRLCLSRFDAQQIKVNVAANNVEPELSDPLTKITLPIPVLLDSVAFGNINVDIEDVVKLQLGSLNAKLEMFQTLQLEQLSLNKINLVLPPANKTQATSAPLDIKQIANWQYQPISLPSLSIPLALSVKSLQVEDLNVVQEQQTLLEVITIASAFDINQRGLAVNQFKVVYPTGELQLNGTVDANLQHELDIALDIQDASQFAQALNIKLHAEGSPQDASISLSSTGALSLQAQIRADLRSAELPLSVEFSWQNIAWPQVQSQSPYMSQVGRFKINGDLQQYTLVVDSDIAGPDIPPSQLYAEANGNLQQINLEQFDVNTLDGLIALTGQLNMSDEVNWQGNLDFGEVKPHLLWPNIIAEIQGEVAHSVSYDGADVRAEISELNASGTWQGYQLHAKGNGTFDPDTGLNIPQLTVSTGDNVLNLNAKRSSTQQLMAVLTLEANDFSQLYPSLSGQSSFNAKVSGTLEQPQVTFSGSGSEIKIPGLDVGGFTSEGTVVWDQSKTLDITTKIRNTRINQQLIESVDVSLKGNAREHFFNTEIQSDTLNLNSQIRGELKSNSWEGTWENGDVSFPGGHFTLQTADTKLVADWQQDHYHVEPNCWQDDSAKFCVERLSYRESQADFELSAQHLPLMQFLSPYLPHLYQLKTDAKLEAKLKGQWLGSGLPTAYLSAQFSPSLWHFNNQDTPLKLEAFTTELGIVDQVKSDTQDLIANVYLLGEPFGSLRADAKIQVSAGERHLEGALILEDLNLQAFQQFLPQLSELQGEMNGQLTLNGTLASPNVSGKVDLHGGVLSGDFLPSRISHLSQTFTFDNTSATLDGPFQLGNGKGQINGKVDWNEQLKANLRVQGSDMEINYQNLLRSKVSPDVHIKFSPNNVDVTGSMVIPYARIKVRELPPEALSPSDDVVLINQDDSESNDKTKLTLKMQIEVDPSSSNNVKLDAFGLTSDLQGSMLLEQDTDILNAIGELTLVNGRYQAYGQDLVIRQGQVLFSGPIDSPTLNIEAIRDPIKTADEVVAGIRVAGGAEQPLISIFSEPSMEQKEALSYLLRGQSFNSTSESSGDAVLANALIGFGMSKAENGIGKVGRKLGVEDLALDASGQGDETKISVSGYVAPGVQLRYGVGVFDSASEVALRYQMSPNLYLEAVSGLSNALDIYYQFSVDQKSAQKSTTQDKKD
jgi:translocation and assembly module TamB